MTDTLGMLLGMIEGTGELPEIPESMYEDLEAKLRAASASEAFSAYWLGWLAWREDHESELFQVCYLRDFDRLTRFVRLLGANPNSEDEAKAWLILWLIYDRLDRLGMGTQLPYECYRMAEGLDVLLRNWPTFQLQKQAAMLDARAQYMPNDSNERVQ